MARILPAERGATGFGAPDTPRGPLFLRPHLNKQQPETETIAWIRRQTLALGAPHSQACPIEGSMCGQPGDLAETSETLAPSVLDFSTELRCTVGGNSR